METVPDLQANVPADDGGRSPHHHSSSEGDKILDKKEEDGREELPIGPLIPNDLMKQEEEATVNSEHANEGRSFKRRRGKLVDVFVSSNGRVV
jgi:hypothetical protein